MPLDAEWEFAARGGVVCRGNFVFSGSNVAGEVAWYNRNSGGSTQPVGTLRPNALGLYDMSVHARSPTLPWYSQFCRVLIFLSSASAVFFIFFHLIL